MTVFPRIEALPRMPGVSSQTASLVRGDRAAPTASPLLTSLSDLEFGPGAAWRDTAFLDELGDEHTRLGASTESLDALAALGSGAACVVTGQQPGLLVGPLYTFYKIAGTVALAEELSRRSGARVVPVYWCGSDDSDFDEVRGAWAWDPKGGPFRAEIPRHVWRDGLRVGDVHSADIASVERAAVQRAGGDPRLRGILASIDGLDGWSDRARAWVLRLFATSGVVVVDARSSRLRALGEPLFTAYARSYDDITGALDGRAEELVAMDWSAPIDAVARRSGLFALEDGRRRKLTPEELRAGDFDPARCAPSVLLRPVWQDALLGPEVAVLGPSEMQYHGQLAPLYEALAVRGARPAYRPHAVVVDADAWSEDEAIRRALLDGGDVALAALRRARMPRTWTDALRAVDTSTTLALDALESTVEGDAALREVRRLRERIGAAVSRSGDRLADATAHGPSPRARVQWYNLRGRPQERAYAATQWWAWWGESAGAAYTALKRAYVASFDDGAVPAWALHRETRG